MKSPVLPYAEAGTPVPVPPKDWCPLPTTVLLAIAATAIGVAIQIDDGEYHPTWGGAAAIALITLAIVAASLAIFWPPRSTATPVGSAPRTISQPPQAMVRGADPTGTATAILSVLLAIEFSLLFFSRPDSQQHPYLQLAGLRSLNVYRAGIALAAAVAALGVGLACCFLVNRVPWASVLACPWSRSREPETTGKRVRLPMAPNLVLKLLFATELVVFTTLGTWSLSHTKVEGSDLQPHIDVFVFQQQAARALLHGRNPYAIADFPDIYADPVTGKPNQQVYGPGMSDGRVLHFGFPYLPVSLYLAVLGYATTGDCRAAHLAALVLSAVIIYLTGSGLRAPTPGRSDPDPLSAQTSELNSSPQWTAALAAALLLFTPRIFFILISGWTEPFLVLWMSAAVYCACRRPRLLPIALGLLLATKQYMALAVLPATILLVPRDASAAGWGSLLPRWRDWLKLLGAAAVVAIVVSAPLALWKFSRFYFSVVTVQRYAPFRWDALSYLTWHAFGHGEPSPAATVILPAVAAAAAIALCLWRAPRTPAGFAASVGLILLVFFAFSKQAFANYYFFVIGTMCCAIAANDIDRRRDPHSAMDLVSPQRAA